MKRKVLGVLGIVILLIGGSFFVYRHLDQTKKQEFETFVKTDEVKKELRHYISFLHAKDISKITESEKVLFLNVVSNGKLFDFTNKNVSLKDANETLQKSILGEEKLKGEDVECFLKDGILYHYDSTKEQYIYNTEHPGHHGKTIQMVPFYEKIQKTSLSKNHYKVTYGYAFIPNITLTDGNEIAVYQDREGKVKLFDAVYDEKGDCFVENETCEQYIEKNTDIQSKLGKYTFEMKKTDGQFHLMNVKTGA